MAIASPSRLHPPRANRVLQSERRWWHNTPRSNRPGCYGDSTPCWRYHLHPHNLTGKVGDSSRVGEWKKKGTFNLKSMKINMKIGNGTKLCVHDRRFSNLWSNIEILMMNHYATIMCIWYKSPSNGAHVEVYLPRWVVSLAFACSCTNRRC